MSRGLDGRWKVELPEANNSSKVTNPASFPGHDEKLSTLEGTVCMSNCTHQCLQGDSIPAHLGRTGHPLSCICLCAEPRDNTGHPGPEEARDGFVIQPVPFAAVSASRRLCPRSVHHSST